MDKIADAVKVLFLHGMKQVLVDMHRLKHNPYNGLYAFSMGLGASLAGLSDPELRLHYYVPREKQGVFGTDQSYVMHRSIDKFYRFGTSAFDVWHITTSLSWYHPFNRRTKVVFTLHDLNFLIEEQHNVKRNKRLLKEMQQRIDRAHYITAISQFAIDFARDHIDFRGKPVSVIYNGVNVKKAGEGHVPVYLPKRKFLFAIGLVQPRKNFHILPALLNGNDYELVIAGLNHFDYAGVIREEARKHGVADRVTLVGPVSETDKYWYMEHCEAFCFPSYAEGFGIPAVEAMSFGKPVFLSTETSLPEVGGDAAYYFRHFDPDHIRAAFAEGMNDYYSTERRQKIMDRAAMFTWENAARQYAGIYKIL